MNAEVFCVDDQGRVFIYGLFDQEVHHRNALNWEDADRFSRPGLFQVEITGIGSLSVYDNWDLIGVINQNAVTRTFHDVLNNGPIAKALAPIIRRHVERIAKILTKNHTPEPDGWRAYSRGLIVRTIHRILLQIRRSAHGGALLLIPSYTTKDLRIKYRLTYEKLDKLLPTHVASDIRQSTCQAISAEMFYEANQPAFGAKHMHLYSTLDPRLRKRFMSECHLNTLADILWEESIAADDKDDCIKGELGCVNFVASLARVDGLLLLAGGLIVRGFGVEITSPRDPGQICAASDPIASARSLRKIDLSQFGTRHRSMMRYCYGHPGSIGFVISQDGDIRAMTRVHTKLIMWDNIKLQDTWQGTPRPGHPWPRN